MPEFLTEYFSGLAQSLESTLKTPDAYLNKVTLSVMIIVIGMLLYFVIKKIMIHSVSDYRKRWRLHKVFRQSMISLIVVLVLFTWVQAMNVFILIGLAFGIFIVFMVRGLTNNIIGYFVIKYRKYFEIGHRIEINGIIGDVIGINSISFTLLEVRGNLSSDTNTGRVIKLPNNIIFEDSVEIVGVNNTFIWHEIKYVLTFESNWQAAEKIMVETGNTYYEKVVEPKLNEYNVNLSGEKGKMEPVFQLDTNADGIVLILRYSVDYRHGTSIKTYLQRQILIQFNENPEIHFAVLEVKVIQR